MTMERVGASVNRLVQAGAARLSKAAFGICPVRLILRRLNMMREDLVPERMAPLSVLMNPRFQKPQHLTELVAGWEYELNEDTIFFSCIRELRSELEKRPEDKQLGYDDLKALNRLVQVRRSRPKKLTGRPE